MQTFLRSLYGRSQPVQKRLYNIIYTFGIIVGLLGMATCYFLETPKQALFISSGMTVLFLLFWIAGNRYTNKRSAFVISTITAVNFIILPLLYFVGGSIDSGIAVYMALGIALTLFFIEGKKGKILCTIETIYYAVIYYISYLYREEVYELTEKNIGSEYRNYTFWATGTNVILVTTGVCILSVVVFNLFREEANLVESSMKQLLKLSQIDSLTSLYTRRFHYDYLVKETTKSRDSLKPFSIILIDIDDFKKVNDTYGHPTGDLVLKEIALIIKDSIEEKDTASRYGGEEFIIALPGKDLSDAKKEAEKIRKAVESHIFSAESGESVHITVSAGVGEYNCGLTAESLIAIADSNMYSAKKSGKNRVCGGQS